MRKYIVAISFVVVLIFVLGVLHTKFYIKRDVPILVERTQVATTTSIIQADILSYTEACPGIIYDIEGQTGNCLVTLPMQSDVQAGIDAGKKYMSVNLYNAATKQMRVFNFDLTNHISACFAQDMAGVYYISYISNETTQRREVMYTTIDNSKTVTVSSADEKVSTGINRAGDNVVYGTSDGKILLANANTEKKQIFAMDERFSIKKVRFFANAQLCIILAENQKTKQSPLYVVDVKNENMKIIDTNARDFDANEKNEAVIYIAKTTDGDQVYLYDIYENRKTYLKSGLVENVFFDESGNKAAYLERAKEEASTFHIGLIDLSSGITNIRLVSDIRLSNRKIVWSGENRILFSEHGTLTAAKESANENSDYIVKKCEFSLTINQQKSNR